MKLGKAYFLLSLFLPIITPLAILPFAFNNFITELFTFSLWFGGVPYLILSIGVIIWAKNKNENQLRKLTYVLPILFVMVMGIVYLLIMLYVLGADFNIKEFLHFFVGLAVYGFALGYFYVIVVNIIYELFISKHEQYHRQS